MRVGTSDAAPGPPGTVRPKRFRPRLHWELLVCGMRGHALLGTDVAAVRPEDALVLREGRGGVRWHRCLRCDSWLPLAPPADPVRDHLPPREEIALPLRGRPLRDKIVLRAIAVERVLHVLALSLIGVVVLGLAANEEDLRTTLNVVLVDIQHGLGGAPLTVGETLFEGLDRVLTLSEGELRLVAAAALTLAAVELVEAIGLWLQRRWAEYLAVVATCIGLPFEIHELIKSVTWFKVSALLVNLAIIAYLVIVHRLFGFRGGHAALQAVAARDVGWPALERTAPGTDEAVPSAPLP
jgi:uncharacterized membrane protein (DUF2068 family)